jgi:hypothetical protein
MNKDINIGDCQLMFGDCLERMKEIPDGSVELCQKVSRSREVL